MSNLYWKAPLGVYPVRFNKAGGGMKLYQLLSFRNKLIILILFVSLIPVLLTGFLANEKYNRLLEDQSKEITLGTLRQSETYLDLYLSEIEQIMLFMSTNNTTLEVLSKQKFESEYEEVVDANSLHSSLIHYLSVGLDIESFDVIGFNGFSYLGHYYNGNWYLENKDSPWIQRIIENKGSPVWFSLNNGKDMVCGRLITGRKYNQGLGIIMLHVPSYNFLTVVNKFQPFGTGFLFLLDQNNSLIAYPAQHMEDIKGIIANGSIANYFHTVIHKQAMFVTKYAMKKTGWSFVAVVPQNGYPGGDSDIRMYFLNTFLVVLLIAVAVSIWLTNRFTKPVKELTRLMRHVEDDDFTKQMTVQSNDEIGLLARSYNRMIVRVNNLIKEVYEQQIRKNEAEWKTLQAQINPHFLYNTLDSINWIARMNKIPEISRMVTALSRLFKLSLSRSGKFVTVAEELEYIEWYKRIQEIRFSDRIEIILDVPEDVRRFAIPRFILQPLVENSIIHGLENKEGKGSVWIKGAQHENTLFFIIQDDGVGIPQEKLGALLNGNRGEERKFGLYNVNERIKLLYGNQWGLKIDSIVNQGTIVEVWIEKRDIGGSETA